MESDQNSEIRLVFGLVIFVLSLQCVNSLFIQRTDQIRCKVPKGKQMVETTYRLVRSFTSYRSECLVETFQSVLPERFAQDKCQELIMNDQVKGECEVLKRV
jgi:hypothetical protein